MSSLAVVLPQLPVTAMNFAVAKQRPVRAEERRGRDAADARGIPLLPAVDPGDETAERPGAFDAGEQTAHCASPSATGDPRKPSMSGR